VSKWSAATLADTGLMELIAGSGPIVGRLRTDLARGTPWGTTRRQGLTSTAARNDDPWSAQGSWCQLPDRDP
jgi:hypothetical protein